MRREIKAALLSGLLFPGAGQIYLKRYRRGVTMIAFALLIFIIILAKAVAAALASMSSMPLTDLAGDPNALARLAAASARDVSAGGKVLMVLFAGCWILSACDAYRIGKRAEGVL